MSTEAESATYRQRGNEHLGRGEWARAAACFRQAASLAPSDAGTQVALGFALLNGGLPNEAVEPLGAAIALDAANADAHFLLGLVKLATKDKPHAISSLRRAIELRPDFEEAHRELIKVLLNDGHADAPAAARSAVDALPTVAEFRYYLGVALHRAGASPVLSTPISADCGCGPIPRRCTTTWGCSIDGKGV